MEGDRVHFKEKDTFVVLSKAHVVKLAHTAAPYLRQQHSTTGLHTKYAKLKQLLIIPFSVHPSYNNNCTNIIKPLIFHNIKGDPSKIAFRLHMHTRSRHLKAISFHLIRICLGDFAYSLIGQKLPHKCVCICA